MKKPCIILYVSIIVFLFKTKIKKVSRSELKMSTVYVTLSYLKKTTNEMCIFVKMLKQHTSFFHKNFTSK